jgi:hypothetical protein
MKKAIVFFILSLTGFVCTANAQQTPFGDGEQLSYSVSYRAALIPNITVMRVTMRTVTENFNGRPHFHIIGSGKTSGSFKGFFDIDNTYHSWLDATTLLPSRATEQVREDDYRASSTYSYDWGSMSVSTVRRKANWDTDRYATLPLARNGGDAFSLLYQMRNIDISTLVQGRAYPLELLLGDTFRTIRYTFAGREQIKIRKVGTFRALRFTCTMATTDGSTYDEGMMMTVWVSDDANKIPLQIESPIRVGSVRIALSGYTAIHPMTSFVK